MSSNVRPNNKPEILKVGPNKGMLLAFYLFKCSRIGVLTRKWNILQLLKYLQ